MRNYPGCQGVFLYGVGTLYYLAINHLCPHDDSGVDSPFSRSLCNNLLTRSGGKRRSNEGSKKTLTA